MKPIATYFPEDAFPDKWKGVQEVRLVDEDGLQLGIRPIAEALNMAREKGLQLFLVQPDANPPVARIIDYERHKFEDAQRARSTKKKHHLPNIEEIKMRYVVDDFEYESNLHTATAFLKNENKVKLLIVLRGREMQFKDLALSLMNKFANDLKEFGQIEREAKIEGKSILMILGPLISSNKGDSQEG